MKSIKLKRAILCVVTCMFWFAQYVYGPFLAPHLMGLGYTATAAGAIVAAYGLTQLILRIPVGITADVVKNHRLFINIGMFLAGISSLGLLMFGGVPFLFVANAVSGMASATWISFTVLYTTYYEPHETSKAIGTINACNNIGILIGFVAGGLLYEKFGIGLLFKLSFLVGMAGLVGSFFIASEKKDTANETGKPTLKISDFASVMASKRLWFFALMGSVQQLINFATANFFATKLVQQLGATGFERGLNSALYTIAGLCGSLFVATRLVRIMKKSALLTCGFTVMLIYCVGLSMVQSVYALFALQLIGGFGNSLLFSLLMSGAVSDVDPAKRSTAMGFFQSVYSIGMTLGPVAMGAMIDVLNQQTAFLIMGGVALAAAVIVAVDGKLRQQRQFG